MNERQKKLPTFIQSVNTRPGTTEGTTAVSSYRMIHAHMQGNPDATAVLESTGILHSITVDDGGSGYTDTPSVVVPGSATAVAVLTPTTIASLTITNGGTRYSSAPAVTISGGGGSGAAATATVSRGSITDLTLTNTGSGYTSPPTVAFSGGGGSGAAATATLTATSVASITVTDSGSGYSSAPTITITGSPGSGATATATVGFEIDSITLANSPDENTKISHVTASQATFSNDLSGAAKTANTTLTDGVITAVTPVAPLGLYTTAPTVHLPVPPNSDFIYSFDNTFTVSKHGADVFLDSVSLFNGVLSSIDTSIINMNVSFFNGTTEHDINVLSNNNQENSYMLSHTNTNANVLAILHQNKYNYLLYLPPGLYNKIKLSLTPQDNSSIFNRTGSGHRIDVNLIVKDRSSDVVTNDEDDVDDVNRNRSFNPISYT